VDSDSDAEAILRSAQQWANENLDSDALDVLSQVDQDKVRQTLASIEKDLKSTDVSELASLRTTARAAISLLEEYEETLPYALWLRSRLDYLDEAERLRKAAKPPAPGKKLAPRRANPEPKVEREIWIQKLQERPWPKAAQPYVPALKKAFSQQKVPPQLVWLAEVESSFDPRARSPVGAAGLFQLMPDTAKRYGLRTGLFDQRVKPEPSAEAAAKYLRFLHRKFKDWRLALAAYNAGEGTVSNLLNHSKVKTYDAIATKLPAETQMFVPKVEATIRKREGWDLNSS
jgi:membrane-bound lytic murein transglycosylase D